jgi:hypothetical protein
VGYISHAGSFTRERAEFSIISHFGQKVKQNLPGILHKIFPEIISRFVQHSPLTFAPVCGIIYLSGGQGDLKPTDKKTFKNLKKVLDK